jgi:DUF1009 family protein
MKIAIIAGCGDFPIQIAKENPDAFVLCIEHHSTPSVFKNYSEIISLKDPLSWISVLKKNKITHLVMAGKINRISKEKFFANELTHDLMNKTLSLGDNSALNLIEKFFNENGFEIMPVTSILKNCFFNKGFFKEEFFSTELKDFVIQNAKFGSNFLNKISEFDVGQSVVVSNAIVYAIEALEGTDEMINRAGELYNNYFKNNNFGPVLIKIPKLRQNLNLDLPVIGLETIKKCYESGFSSIVISSKGTLIADIEMVKKYLKKNKFCVFAI